jgi:hypothetical protein
MADHPSVPPDVIDAVMASPTAHRLAYFMHGHCEPSPGDLRDLRTDLSDLIAIALEAWINVPVSRAQSIAHLSASSISRENTATSS